MTETVKCPICGANCNKYERGGDDAGRCPDTYQHIQTDLTKLREAYKGFEGHWKVKWISLNHERCLDVLMQVVKELLEENKP